MNIIISNAYCYLNKGDAGIIRAMVQEFKKEYPDSKIKVISLYKDLDQGKYGDCEVIDCLITPYTGKSRLMKIIRNVFLFCLIYLLNALGVPFNSTSKDIKNADIVVSCGGGYLKARNLAQFLGDFMYHYVQFITALQYRKKFVIYAQTVGTFGNEFVKSRIKNLLQKSSLILPRETISYNYLCGFIPDAKNYFHTSDIAFLLDKKEVNVNIPFQQKLKIGITMRTWHFPGEADRAGLLENYKMAVINMIKHILSNYNASIYLMPQVIGPGPDNDLLISTEVYQEFLKNDSVHLVDDNLTPEELKYLYSKMDLFIGTRMHSNIFALSEHVPCVAISYDLKTDGIMQDVGLGDYVLNIKGIKEKELIQKVDSAIHSLDSMKEILALSVPKIKDKSRLNNVLLNQLIKGKLNNGNGEALTRKTSNLSMEL
ncbi:polysaccharide pyruvyl transferase family protein [Paenibacillus terreus]|uniref:Polysaccharide pyruvyl transferase family protein n=1 Tax=Paenibacillus terreus TaxID=1387834 RepID=A0ABV5B5H1_9BACL